MVNPPVSSVTVIFNSVFIVVSKSSTLTLSADPVGFKDIFLVELPSEVMTIPSVAWTSIVPRTVSPVESSNLKWSDE